MTSTSCTKTYCLSCGKCNTTSASSGKLHSVTFISNEGFIEPFNEKPGIIRRHPSGYNERLDKKGNWQKVIERR